jgi:hypothetical protein
MHSTSLTAVLVLLLFAAVWTRAAAPASAELPDVAALPSIADLPDPLKMLDGKVVTTKEEWVNKRRPELKLLFQHYMYGYLPPTPAKVPAKVEYEDRKAFGGKATLREIALTVGPPEVPKLYLLVATPNERKGPAPVFVGPNFCGNHALVEDKGVRIPPSWMYANHPGVKDNRATEEGRGKERDVWAIEQSIDRGYAVATFYPGDLDPDRKEAREGIRPFFAKEDERHGPHHAGTIAVWAWGVQRAVDYLVTDKEIDPKRIAAVGHSRLGKTALLAAAFDERIALAIPHQAGCGGTGPSRSKSDKAESVKRINASFPHWFCDTFKEFNDHADRLPFDQNCLAALVAPRPLLFSNAVEDLWANPDGQFDVLVAADPVYRLLGSKGLGSKTKPEVGKLLDSPLGYYIRPGKHSMTKEDWQVFLDFADKNLGKP